MHIRNNPLANFECAFGLTGQSLPKQFVLTESERKTLAKARAICDRAMVTACGDTLYENVEPQGMGDYWQAEVSLGQILEDGPINLCT